MDGKPLALHSFAGVMLEARIPPGRDRVELWYWPDALTVGLVLALCTGAVLVAATVTEETYTRRRRTSH